MGREQGWRSAWLALVCACACACGVDQEEAEPDRSRPWKFGERSSGDLVVTWRVSPEAFEEDPSIWIGFGFDEDVVVEADTDDDGIFEYRGEEVFRKTIEGPGVYTVWLRGNMTQARFCDSGTEDITIEQWGRTRWDTMQFMFFTCKSVHIADEVGPDLTDVQDMSSMFSYAAQVSGSLEGWDVSNVRDMSFMFTTVKEWNVSLASWDVSSVRNMNNMFSDNEGIEGGLDTWDVSSVEDMEAMFQRAGRFVGDVSGWDVSNVTDMSHMFMLASSFNSNLSGWDISSVSDMTDMFIGAGLSARNYDATLTGWLSRGDAPRDVDFDASGLTYCEAADARATLIAEYGWTFEGDTLSCGQ